MLRYCHQLSYSISVHSTTSGKDSTTDHQSITILIAQIYTDKIKHHRKTKNKGWMTRINHKVPGAWMFWMFGWNINHHLSMLTDNTEEKHVTWQNGETYASHSQNLIMQGWRYRLYCHWLNNTSIKQHLNSLQTW